MEFSSGILLYRYTKNKKIQVLLLLPGGPYFSKNRKQMWTIPKGKIEKNETAFEAALREFKEETGFNCESSDENDFIELGQIKQSKQKKINVWAYNSDLDTTQIKSNTFEIEWPPKTGQKKIYSEITKGKWIDIEKAFDMMLKGQTIILDLLLQKLKC